MGLLGLPDVTPDFVDDAVGAGADFVGDRAKDVAHGVGSLAGVVAKTAEGAWDLATDPIELVYAEARKGVARLQQQLEPVADLASNPVGDADSLRQAARTWGAVADALAAEGRHLDARGPSLARSWTGPNADRFLDGVQGFGGSIDDVERAARDVQRLLDRGAGSIDQLNHEVHLLVAETAAWIGFSVVLALITGGGGLAVGVARVARTVQKVTALVEKAKRALVALRVAQAVRFSRLTYGIKATADVSRLSKVALAGASTASKAAKAATATGAKVGGTRLGRLGKGLGSAANPLNSKVKRIALASSTASSAMTTALVKDPRTWTPEDVTRILLGGYLSAAGAKPAKAILERLKVTGTVSQAAIQSAVFGSAASVATQQGFRGEVDPKEAALTGLFGGTGGALGRASVRRALAASKRDKEAAIAALGPGASTEAKKRIDDVFAVRDELTKARGRLGAEAIGEGALRQGGEVVRGGGAASTPGATTAPGSPRLDVPAAPKLHTIRPGESLWSIAGDRLHDPEVWRRIRRANPGLTDPDLIRPGDRVAIPAGLGFRVAG